ncbi:hypothetical protein NS226_08110 [Aureimonas ureilytica]|uniref:DUF6878 domain-containing protein n=1 Tax=Aureimonas ureilytica TaxID=401562 RepID=A0A175RA77_9HYPH|nr:hypothetical protein NS226_08110 [Aureimonas ureilytica]
MPVAHDNLEASIRDANKATVFNALALAGITRAVVSFDGYGDSGQIENIEAETADGPIDLPDARLHVLVAEWGQALPVEQDLSIADLIERLVYDYLGTTHPGWQDGEGAYGEFVFDVATGTITLDHNDRYIDSEHSTHEF